MPGRAYATTVRLFVSPPSEGWVRVNGEFDAALLPTLVGEALCLSVMLRGAQATIAAYHHRVQVAVESAFADFLRDDCTPDDVRRIAAGEFDALPPIEQAPQPQVMAVPFDALPQNIQTLASDVDADKAQKMFERISGNLMNKASGQQGDAAADAARKMLHQDDTPDWNSAGGQRIRALMRCLTIPADWREPDFVTLRDAYQLHARRQRKPDARLYPGDAEAMAKVPNALEYIPVYAGKDA